MYILIDKEAPIRLTDSFATLLDKANRYYTNGLYSKTLHIHGSTLYKIYGGQDYKVGIIEVEDDNSLCVKVIDRLLLCSQLRNYSVINLIE